MLNFFLKILSYELTISKLQDLSYINKYNKKILKLYKKQIIIVDTDIYFLKKIKINDINETDITQNDQQKWVYRMVKRKSSVNEIHTKINPVECLNVLISNVLNTKQLHYQIHTNRYNINIDSYLSELMSNDFDFTLECTNTELELTQFKKFIRSRYIQHGGKQIITKWMMRFETKKHQILNTNSLCNKYKYNQNFSFFAQKKITFQNKRQVYVVKWFIRYSKLYNFIYNVYREYTKKYKILKKFLCIYYTKNKNIIKLNKIFTNMMTLIHKQSTYSSSNIFLDK